MSEKKATGYKAQSVYVIDHNKAKKAARHAKRMGIARRKTEWAEDGSEKFDLRSVARGTARRQRRAPLAIIYAKRLAAGNIPA